MAEDHPRRSTGSSSSAIRRDSTPTAELVKATPWDEIERQSGVDDAKIRELAEIYLQVGIGDHRLVSGRHAAGARGRHGTRDRQCASAARQPRPRRRRAVARCAAKRTCRAIARAASTTARPSNGWPGSTRRAASDPPREHGLDTVAHDSSDDAGEVKVFVAWAATSCLAAPDTQYTFAALRKCDLTVQVSTKLNRSHLVHGRNALILPCLGRTEKESRSGPAGRHRRGLDEHGAPVVWDEGAGSPRPALGVRDPRRHGQGDAAGLDARRGTTTPRTTTSSATRWREALEGFEDFNRRVRQPLGFRLRAAGARAGLPTASGRAEFSPRRCPTSSRRTGG